MSASEGSPAHDSGFLPSGCLSGVPWFCYRTTWNGERLAEIELRRRGFCAWGPQFLKPWQNGQGRIVEMFPRYGFVQFDPDGSDWPAMFGTRGVEWLFCSINRRPVQVLPRAMDALFSRCAPNGVVYPPRKQRLRKGDAVTINDSASPFDGWVGVCELADESRIVVLLSLFAGRAVRVGLDREACLPART